MTKSKSNPKKTSTAKKSDAGKKKAAGSHLNTTITEAEFERLQSSQELGREEARALGRELGEEWAKNDATYLEVERLVYFGPCSNLVELMLGLDIDLRGVRYLFGDIVVHPLTVQGFSHAAKDVFFAFLSATGNTDSKQTSTVAN